MKYAQTNRLLEFQGNANCILRPEEGLTFQYAAGFNTIVSWIPNHFHMSGNALTRKTGVIANIHIKEPDAHASFHLMTHHNPGFPIQANQPVFVSLAPYHTYITDLKNTSNRAYFIKKHSKKVTLYPGNIQWLDWYAVPKHIMIGQLVNPKGSPLAYVQIKDQTNHFISTDQYGYFQVEVDRGTKQLRAHTHGKVCILKLPSFSWKNTFTYIGKTKCLSLSS